jgi:hypothetical protein
LPDKSSKIFEFFGFFLALIRKGTNNQGSVQFFLTIAAHPSRKWERVMSDSALDRQVQIALRGDKKREKLAEHISELTAQIANATFKFSQDVKSAYESAVVPKRRLSDRDFDEVDQAKLTLGAFSFFMHILDRYLLGIDSRLLRQTVLDFIFENLADTYAKSFPGSPAETETFVFNHYNGRVSHLADVPTIIGAGPEDRNSALGRASRAICDEDLGRDDRRLVSIVGTGLMDGLETLAFADHIAVMAQALSLPGDLRNTA